MAYEIPPWNSNSEVFKPNRIGFTASSSARKLIMPAMIAYSMSAPNVSFATNSSDAITQKSPMCTYLAELGPTVCYEPINPNTQTIDAIESARRGELFTCDSIASLFRDLDEEY